MPLFSSRRRSTTSSSVAATTTTAAAVATPPPPPRSSEQQHIYYTVRSPWEWVMQEVAQQQSSTKTTTTTMIQVESVTKLPSAMSAIQQHSNNNVNNHNNGNSNSQQSIATPNAQRRRTLLKRGPVPCTLRLEVCKDDNNNDSSLSSAVVSSPSSSLVLFAIHGTSAGLDGLEDKDELVRTMQRCRCDHLHFAPPSILIKWDITRDELTNVVPSLPTLTGVVTNDDNNKDKDKSSSSSNSNMVVAVLKEPMGSRGEGIYFVKDHDDAFRYIEQHRIEKLEEPNLLDNIMEQKGRMPAWVLQAEVYPPMLIMGGKKFTIRTNVVLVETTSSSQDDTNDDDDDDLAVKVYIYNRHEVRIAGRAVEDVAANVGDDDNADGGTLLREPLAHITNGVNSTTTQRALLTTIPELASAVVQDELLVFVAKAFQSFMPDITRRVGYSASQGAATTTTNSVKIRKFAIAGVDIMMTDRGRFYLLEVNVNPSAPPKDSVEPDFKEHLIGWMKDLCDLTLGKPCSNFVNIYDVVPPSS